MPDDHSELVPPLTIPNRTVKRFRADDSAATSVKVGYRQACYMQIPVSFRWRGFLLWATGLQAIHVAPDRTSTTRSGPMAI